jgi:hypothetical protein
VDERKKQLKVVDVDLCGPVQERSLGGVVCFLLLVNIGRGYTAIDFSERKDAKGGVRRIFYEIDNFSRRNRVQVKNLRSNNSTDFVNNCMDCELSMRGIYH